MHKPAVFLLMLATAFLAGCAEEAGEDDAPVAEPATQFESEVVQVAAPTMPRDPPEAGERTLDAAPQWRMGEWWTYEMDDGFTGGHYEFTRVVAGEDRAAGNYLVGFPVDDFSNDVMLFHIPGFGDIRKADLAYETHDAYFQPLDFPMQDGKTWETEFEGLGTGTAFATVTEPGKAHVEMLVGGGYNITGTYDAEMGEFSHMLITQGQRLYAEYTVTGHGYGYEGVIRIPHAHDLVFIHGRLAGLVNAGAGQSAAGPLTSSVTETVVVDPGYDRLAFILAVGGGNLVGNVPGTQTPLPTVGYFEETVTAPDGTVYSETFTPADYAAGQGVKITAVGHDFPEGEWQLRHVAGGGGIAFVEGIGYHSIDIELPSGCVIASFNAQHHNADCKTTYEDIEDNAGGNATAATSTGSR